MMKKKYLLLLIPLLFIQKVNATEIVQSYFFDVSNNGIKQERYSSRESHTYSNQYLLLSDNKSRFFGFTYCTNGDFSFNFPNDIEGSTTHIGIYDSNVPCNTNASGSGAGTIKTFYFLALSLHDAGQGRYSIRFNLRAVNNTSSEVHLITNTLFIAEDIPPNINYTNNFNSLNNGLNSISQQQNTLSNQQQEILNKQQQIINEQRGTTSAVNDVNDSINNDDVTGAEDSAGGFFNDFTTDTHGLTAVITAPLSLITSITSSSCSPLVIPLPYVDKDLTLPCMSTIYSNYFGSFLSIYQMITFGIIAYWVLIRIFNLVKDFKNPDHDEIEVLDL